MRASTLPPTASAPTTEAELDFSIESTGGFHAESARRSFALIAGMNLPLLVEMATQLDSLDADKAKAAVEGSRSFIMLCEAADMLADVEEEEF